MKISESTIRRTMPQVYGARVSEFVRVFNEWADRFGITTPLRTAHFLSQVAHESGQLRYVEENLNYSASGLLKTFPRYFTAGTVAAYARRPEKIANRVYGGRMGNGPESSGDGWRYRGRGLIQLTGRANYQAYATSGYCNGDLLAHPEWLAQMPGALKSAMWFWQARGLNALADGDDSAAVTRRVNGGVNGLSDRQYFLRQAKKALGI